MLHKIRFSSLVAACAVLFTAVLSQAEVVERIVAIVNDEIVTLSDLNKYQERLRTGGLTDDLLVPDEAAKEALLKDREKLLQKMIDERVIDSEVKQQGLSVPIERVEQEIRTIAKRNNVSRDELKSALQERGIAFSQYQDFIKTGLERQALIERAITSRIKISEDDVTAQASGVLGSKAQAYEYTIAHIFFNSSKPGGADAAKKRAENVLNRLRGGAKFDQVASDLSEDPAFEQGGLLGSFRSGDLQKELEQVLIKLNAGQITDILPTRGGFHIVKLLRKRAVADQQSDSAREKIRAQLYEQAYKKQFQSWLEQLRQEAFIRVNGKTSQK